MRGGSASWASASSTRGQPSLEAQVANLADEIAYNNHDVDDGLRSGLLSEAALCSVPLFRRHYEPVVRASAGSAPRRVLIHETIRAMINEVVTDLVETSRRNIEARRLRSSDDVRALDQAADRAQPGHPGGAPGPEALPAPAPLPPRAGDRRDHPAPRRC